MLHAMVCGKKLCLIEILDFFMPAWVHYVTMCNQASRLSRYQT